MNTPSSPMPHSLSVANATDSLTAELQRKVRNTLLEAGMLDGHTHLMVGFSGGLDSTVLLHLLAHCRTQHPALKLTAVMVEHGWRGRPVAELPHVMQCCKNWQIPLVWVTVPAHQNHTELNARQQRYDAFRDLGQQLNAQAVVLAHHADDQVETVLFRLCRGTGVTGLMGMSTVRLLDAAQKGATHNGKAHKTKLVRPLLNFTRAQLQNYANIHQLSGFNDPTNASMAHARNVIRHMVLPLLREHFPQVDTSLHRLSQLAADTNTLLNFQLEAVWPLVVPKPGVLKFTPFCQLAPALQRPLIRRFLLPYVTELSMEQTEHLLNTLLNDREEDGVLFSLGADPLTQQPRFVSLYRGDITVRVQPVENPRTYPVNVTSEFGLSDVPSLSSLMIYPVADKNSYWVDGTWRVMANLRPFMHLPLVWRTREPGDRFCPEGHQTVQKLKHYLMEQHIHRFDRDTLLMLACGRNILWIPGLARSRDIVPQGTHPDEFLPSHFLMGWSAEPLFDYIPLTESPIQAPVKKTSTAEDDPEKAVGLGGDAQAAGDDDSADDEDAGIGPDLPTADNDRDDVINDASAGPLDTVDTDDLADDDDNATTHA
jgi:tRNA(Ile)-lysidine synthase